MIRFTHSICTAFRGESCRDRGKTPHYAIETALLVTPHPTGAPFTPPASPTAPHLRDAGAREGHDDGHDVHGQLELQELGDAVVDVASPHHRLDDAGEVVVRQDDVRCLFRHVRARDALEEQGESDGVSHGLSSTLAGCPETAPREKSPGARGAGASPALDGECCCGRTNAHEGEDAPKQRSFQGQTPALEHSSEPPAALQPVTKSPEGTIAQQSWKTAYKHSALLMPGNTDIPAQASLLQGRAVTSK